MNNQGQVVRRYDFLPFGEEIVAGVGGRGADYEPSSYMYPTTPDDVLKKFTGKERDAETGLDYFGARYFSGAQGRFTLPDWSAKPQPVPYANLEDPQTLNLYGYVRNNPLSKTDLDGHCFEDACVIEVSAVGTGVLYGGAAIAGAVGLTGVAVTLHNSGDAIISGGKSLIGSIGGLIFKSESKPGTLGRPDHQQTAKEEAKKIGGDREVPIPTTGGAKDSRRADAAKKDAAGNITDVTQVYRPTPAGNIPKREVDAARDIENATGVKPTMVPVRPLPVVQ
jgi:RHS repeat-associated protein